MTTPSPKDVVRRFLDEGSGPNGWNMDVINECFSPDYVSHTWGGDLAHTGARMGRVFSAFAFVERFDSVLIAEGEWVVHRSRDKRRHTGEAFGLAPTEKEVVVDHVEMWRVENGQIVEHWGGLGVGPQLYRALTTP